MYSDVSDKLSVMIIITSPCSSTQVTGQVDRSVFERGLVSEQPKWKDIVEGHGTFHHNTAQRTVRHMTLAYVTPVSYHDSNVLSKSSVGLILFHVHPKPIINQ